MTLKEIRTITITSKGQVAIPVPLRRRAGFRVGQKVAVLAFDDHLELRPIDELAERLYPALMSERSLAKDWDRPEEDEAWKDLGRETS